jgi:hypothetical protein
MAKKHTSASAKAQIRKEIDQINKATHDYVVEVMEYAKQHPKGLSIIERSVRKVAANMNKLEAHSRKVWGV